MLLPKNWTEYCLSDIACIAPLQEVKLKSLSDSGVRLFIKREDLLHPIIGGNKIYKLHGHLREHQCHSSHLPIASFGGAYSNHILALAVTGQMLGIETVGVIRGERPTRLSSTLKDAENAGMRLLFVSRQDYRQRGDKQYHTQLERQLGPCFWVPEGGAGSLGIEGCAAMAHGILKSCEQHPTAVFHASGTGASIAGLTVGFATYRANQVYTYGVSVLKGYTTQMRRDIIRELTHKKLYDSQHGTEGDVVSQTWKILDEYHFGGYAKYPERLAQFVQSFEQETMIPLDPVYTAKVIWACVDQIKRKMFSPGDRLIVIHSGGLQGRRGFGLNFDNGCVY
ncbi:1-aminocyclopropane-1-carboxylate deaminase/D-cysteine desulfhydrase [Agarilytica rhodophyticola]|uniref:1-aminocyclopropane-1-carboxylate deaminase/D-cysteine desulfhydrase n=1 Tax=Agarilytica rhodophyticola TaxID=1737490 RepID=UPI000B346047|nr:pyridoxal-phosphate dependent enzyme [Agarilytica rhodophyticola]